MKTQFWTLESKRTMPILTPNHFQRIDEEIVAQLGSCSRQEQLKRIRELAEIYRVYMTRTALMARELHDEKQYQ